MTRGIPLLRASKKNLASTLASTHRVRTLHSSRLCWFLDRITTHILSRLWNTENYCVSLRSFFSLSLCGVISTMLNLFCGPPLLSPAPHRKKPHMIAAYVGVWDCYWRRGNIKPSPSTGSLCEFTRVLDLMWQSRTLRRLSVCSGIGRPACSIIFVNHFPHCPRGHFQTKKMPFPTLVFRPGLKNHTRF